MIKVFTVIGIVWAGAAVAGLGYYLLKRKQVQSDTQDVKDLRDLMAMADAANAKANAT